MSNLESMTEDKQREYVADFAAECGCYELRGFCYDREGEPTHQAGEECNN